MARHAEGRRTDRDAAARAQHPQAGGGALRRLAPLLGATAPVDDDFTFTFPAGALRTPVTAEKFALALEYLATGIAVGAAARVLDAGVAGTLTSVVACEGQHLGALSALAGGSPVPTDLPAGLDIVDASNQLSQFLSN